MGGVLKAVMEKETSTVFELTDWRLFSIDFVENYFFSKAGSRELVIRPKNFGLDNINYLRDVLKKNYFCQLGFIQQRAEIECSETDDSFKYLLEISAERDDLRKLISSTYKDSFNGEWSDYVGKEKTKENEAFFDLMANPSNSIIIKNRKTGNVIALMNNFSSKTCLDERVEQIGWVWVSEKLLSEERAYVHSVFRRWLKNRNAIRFQAGIHLYNERSIKFFKKMGFVIKCAHISKN